MSKIFNTGKLGEILGNIAQGFIIFSVLFFVVTLVIVPIILTFMNL